MNNTMWDERYAQKEYVFGTIPNEFFREQLDKLSPGRVLLPGEGEGRNAVYAAEHGWEVKAFDASEQGRKKALQLASVKTVRIDYTLSNIMEMSYCNDYFDVIGIIYVHFPEYQRKLHFRKLISLLKPGGLVILECFSKDQLTYNSGGPKDISMLLSEEDIRHAFSDLQILTLSREIINLNEGKYHQGKASVVRFIGKKPPLVTG